MTKRRDGMSDKDRSLFERAMDNVKPLKRRDRVDAKTPSVVQSNAEDLPDEWLKGTGLKAIATFRHPSLERGKADTNDSALSPREGIDRKTRRALEKGRERVDRTIDLHGLNQVNAFSVLVRTIERAVLRDMKTVLVITGKGGARFSQISGGAASRTRADFDIEGGVLKRMVPLWLSGETLRPFVESYAPAAKSHGGEGALYVRLRRRRVRLEGDH